jgi:hypothetical protein
MLTVPLDQVARIVRVNPIMIVSRTGDTQRTMRYGGKHSMRAVLAFLGSRRETQALVLYAQKTSGKTQWIDVRTGAICDLC